MRRLRRRRPLVQVQRAMADPIIDAVVGAAKAKARLCAYHAGMRWGQRLRVARHGTARSAHHRTVSHAAWWLSQRTMPGGMRACRCVQVAEVEGGAAAWALDGRVLVDDVAVQARHSSGHCDDRFGLRCASLSV
jgi:hypothetical protein